MMQIDTLAYTKHLERAGVERKIAEAHAEALLNDVLPCAVPATSQSKPALDSEWWVIAIAFGSLIANIIVWRH